MPSTFIITNQDGHYWGRGKVWVDGSDTGKVAPFDHRDEASNTVFELSSKDFSLRASIEMVELSDGKLPKLTVSEVPLPATEEESPETPTESEVNAELAVENPL